MMKITHPELKTFCLFTIKYNKKKLKILIFSNLHSWFGSKFENTYDKNLLNSNLIPIFVIL